MILARAATVSILATLVAACSGATASIDSSPDGATSDGASSDGASGDGGGGCLTQDPDEGSACTSGQTVCDRGVDVCCRGYAWVCDSLTHTWQKAGLGCACKPDAGPPDAGFFTCGDKTCAPDEYCTTASGGVPLPDAGSNTSYTCTKIPPACAAAPTCACLESNGGASCGNCNDTSGHIEVTCLYP
jgi:hypothetical protein